MKRMDVRILHLHPSVLNVAGDGGNVRALEQRARWRGIDVAVRRSDPGDSIEPGWADITIIGGGQDTEMRVAADGLRAQARALRDSVEAGAVIFAVCAGLQLLGRAYVPIAGEPIEGLGMLDLETRGGPTRFMQHAACEVELDGETGVVVGFENHSGLTQLGPGARPFGKVVLGAGNNGVDGTEGARPTDGTPILSTYLHGPVLPKNPWLTDRLLAMALARRHGKVELAPLADRTETRAHDESLLAANRARGRQTAIPAARLGR
jgi:lipid II isoglutaminyl synthase (glutamine-hydrolysing)